MASTTDEAEAAAERLEAALERIARTAAAPLPGSALPEIKGWLDRMIERLRAVLDS